MTIEEIDKIASDYLNDCESELDMIEVFAVAKELLEQEPILDKIRAEIEKERTFQRAMDEYDIATGLRKSLEIIDKYREEQEE